MKTPHTSHKPAVKPPEVAIEPVPEVLLPKLGDIVIYRLPDRLAPMLVTQVNEASFDGQVFHDGTQVQAAYKTVFGDEPGQCVPPTNSIKEA